ncbi:MAG: ABC transporter permease subunit [Myxococcota bacterium]|nr:ABC transporter permease subunit [Myxococcota bacterium]
MSAVWAIAVNTWRESIRDRVLYSLFFFAAVIIVVSLGAKELSIGDVDKVVRSVALGAIRLFADGFALMLGVGLVYKELERRTIYTIASKPLARWRFILGKYLGLMGVLATLLAGMALLYTLSVGLQQGLPGAEVYWSWALLYVELALLTAWALLLSTGSSPTVATFFAVSIYLIGNAADDIWRFGSQAESESLRQLAEIVYWVLPNFSVLSLTDLAVHQQAVPLERALGGIVYGVGYSVVVLLGAFANFSRRDFK